MSSGTLPTVVAGPSLARRRRVFLSHSSKDATIMEWVAAQVRAMGIEPYVASQESHPGALLAQKVSRAITETDAVIVLLTEAGAASAYVQQEVGVAIQASKPILALVDSAVAGTSLAMLDGLEYVPFSPLEPAASTADLIRGLQAIADSRGIGALESVVVQAPPALQLQMTVQLQLSGQELLVGLMVVAAVAILVYVAAKEASQ